MTYSSGISPRRKGGWGGGQGGEKKVQKSLLGINGRAQGRKNLAGVKKREGVEVSVGAV